MKLFPTHRKRVPYLLHKKLPRLYSSLSKFEPDLLNICPTLQLLATSKSETTLLLLRLMNVYIFDTNSARGATDEGNVFIPQKKKSGNAWLPITQSDPPLYVRIRRTLSASRRNKLDPETSREVVYQSRGIGAGTLPTALTEN